MSYTLVPTWLTPAQKIITVIETDEINHQLYAREEVSIDAEAGENVFELTAGADRVTAVLVNGDEVAFTVDDGNIVIDTLDQDATVLVRTDTMPIFRFLNGRLPVGIELTLDGHLEGRTGNAINPNPETYRFTARISNEAFVRDRTFEVEVIGYFYAGYLNPKSMRGGIEDDDLGFTYHPLATLRRGTPFKLTLDVLDRDGIIPPIKIDFVQDIEEDHHYGTLPVGLRLVEREIVGRISPTCPHGMYFFTVVVDDPIQATQITFRVEVLDDIEPMVKANPEIIWVTPAGSLGLMKEADRSLVGVEAKVIGGVEASTYHDPVLPELRGGIGPVYTLAPGSGPLPPGLSLRENTGAIIGVIAPTTVPNQYSFTVRARSGYAYSDRTFNIDVEPVYHAIPFHSVHLRMGLRERFEFRKIYKDIIPSDYLYNHEEQVWGIPLYPDVYIISGLDGRTPFAEGVVSGRDDSAEQEDAYFKPLDLVMGEHKIGLTRDFAGRVVFEVVYRPLFDPQELAGGFKFGVDVATPVPVAKGNGEHVYPVSIRNQRNDLVRRFGFATLDATKQYLLGPNGVEVMPLWMRTEQVLGDQRTVPGFTLAMVAAYVKPGMGRKVLEIINTKTEHILRFGHVYSFDRYIRTTNSATQL